MDLAVVIAYQEVRDRRGFTATRDLRQHLEGLLRALTEATRSTKEGGP
jgi:hypothetical protein